MSEITKEALLARREALTDRRNRAVMAMAACDGGLVAINEMLQFLEAPDAETEEDVDDGTDRT